MARPLNRLSAVAYKAALQKPGRHADGGGLYLVVSNDGRARWVFRYTLAGKTRDLGLGGGRDVGLADARKRASEARQQVIDGHDPVEARKGSDTAAASAAEPVATKPVTFGDIANDLLRSIEGSFRNAKHRAQWRMTLEVYARPLWNLPIATIDTEAVLGVLSPLWSKMPETASRLRGRIERVIDAALARGLRQTANPARWKGHLAVLLPKRKKLMRGHHQALPYQDLPSLVTRLHQVRGMAARALEFTILTAARSGEVLGMTWTEVDLAARVWTVPGTRMKAGRPHRVPLPHRAVSILEEMAKLGMGPSMPVFPSSRRDKPMSNMAMAMCLRRLEPSVTVHGTVRSGFRDWAGDATTFPRELAEAALAHVLGNATERAYRRSDALERRREMMEAWGAYVCSKIGTQKAEDLDT